MKFLPGAVIVDPISGHVFALPSATPTLMTAMLWQRRRRKSSDKFVSTLTYGEDGSAGDAKCPLSANP
jgi:hypothetical protein